jgi:Electron transfer DM13
VPPYGPHVPSIGDLANDVARTLYEQRVPVAIASVVGLVAVVLVARRLGWFAAARRHPARGITALAIILLIGGPIAWYLGSPLFIRTALVERSPIVGAPATRPTRAPTPRSESPSISPTPSPSASSTDEPEPTPFVPITLAQGEFSGTDEFHFGRGTASIVEIEPGRYHLRLDDFSVRNGPDLYVYLSPDPSGYTDDSLEVGVLKATDGSFGYDLPTGIDPVRFRSALIWCKQFSHLFAVAPLVG